MQSNGSMLIRDSHLFLLTFILEAVILQLMPRLARIVVEDVPHHIVQRGNNRQDVFFVNDDRRVYLEILKRQSQKWGLDILAFCLMTNHIHLIAIPRNEQALSKAIGRTHFLYTQYLNRMHRRSGHLWQNRFYSCPLGGKHLWQTLRYIETNPVRAKLVRCPWRYPFSSAADHINGKSSSTLLDMKWWKKYAPDDWQTILKQPLDDKEIAHIRLTTNTGRPLASDSLISKLEKSIGRRLRPLPVGRPKKKVHKKTIK